MKRKIREILSKYRQNHGYTMEHAERELLELFSVGNCKWVYVEKELPLCYKEGHWDGKMSDLCVCEDSEGKFHLAHCYEYDTKSVEWYDKDDYGLRHSVVRWFMLRE